MLDKVYKHIKYSYPQHPTVPVLTHASRPCSIEANARAIPHLSRRDEPAPYCTEDDSPEFQGLKISKMTPAREPSPNLSSFCLLLSVILSIVCTDYVDFFRQL